MNWYFMKGKNVMKRFEKSSELLWIFGTLFVALGVSICSKADLGVSMIAAPAFIISEALTPLWSGFSVGVTEYVIQGVMLIILCILIRKFNWRYLLGFAVAIFYRVDANGSFAANRYIASASQSFGKRGVNTHKKSILNRIMQTV